MLYFSHGSTNLRQTFRLYANIHPTYHANFIEITDIVPQIQQFKLKVHFLPRDALLSAVYAVVVCLSVCVCVSVTLRYCIKTAKRRITQITLHDSPLTLVF